MRSRTYDKEFKIGAINLYKNGKTQTQVCKDLGIPGAIFSGWIKECKVDKEEIFRGSGKPKASNYVRKI